MSPGDPPDCKQAPSSHTSPVAAFLKEPFLRQDGSIELFDAPALEGVTVAWPSKRIIEVPVVTPTTEKPLQKAVSFIGTWAHGILGGFKDMECLAQARTEEGQVYIGWSGKCGKVGCFLALGHGHLGKSMLPGKARKVWDSPGPSLKRRACIGSDFPDSHPHIAKLTNVVAYDRVLYYSCTKEGNTMRLRNVGGVSLEPLKPLDFVFP